MRTWKNSTLAIVVSQISAKNSGKQGHYKYFTEGKFIVLIISWLRQSKLEQNWHKQIIRNVHNRTMLQVSDMLLHKMRIKQTANWILREDLVSIVLTSIHILTVISAVASGNTRTKNPECHKEDLRAWTTGREEHLTTNGRETQSILCTQNK